MKKEQEHGAIVWHNGKMIPWEDATIHVMTHVINYGSSVFEGIRCYNTKRGSAIFRLDAHVERLLNSAHIYRMEVPYGYDEITEACLQLVSANEYKECYLRPLIFRGYGTFGVDPFPCRNQRVLFRREIDWVRRCARTTAECAHARCLDAIGDDAIAAALDEVVS